jgi:hypothetical protein
VPRDEPWPGDDATAVEKRLTTRNWIAGAAEPGAEVSVGPYSRRKNPTGGRRFPRALESSHACRILLGGRVRAAPSLEKQERGTVGEEIKPNLGGRKRTSRPPGSPERPRSLPLPRVRRRLPRGLRPCSCRLLAGRGESFPSTLPSRV